MVVCPTKHYFWPKINILKENSWCSLNSTINDSSSKKVIMIINNRSGAIVVRANGAVRSTDTRDGTIQDRQDKRGRDGTDLDTTGRSDGNGLPS